MYLRLLVVAVLFLGFSSSELLAEKRFVKCPRFVVDQKAGTYRSIQEAAGSGVRCSNNVAGLRRIGYLSSSEVQPTKTDPANIANPELDTERVFRGKGSTTIQKAFRVSSTARVVTATVTNCFSNGNAIYSIGSLEVLNPTVGDNIGEIVTIYPNKPLSVTMFSPDIYSVAIDLYSDTFGSCDFEIKVQ